MEELCRRLDVQEGQIAALTETVFVLLRVMEQRDWRAADSAIDRLETARAIVSRNAPAAASDAVSAFFDGAARRLEGHSI